MDRDNAAHIERERRVPSQAARHEPNEVQLERRGWRRVIVGWEGFDAAQAVQDAREEHLDRLAGRRREADS
jgi:G:T-mismatch repair DNA endonuclease (very short patch repair protein)